MPWDTLGGLPIPPERQDRFIKSMLEPEQPNMWESTAHHEAGHAVVAVALNFAFSHVGMENHVFTRPGQENLGGVAFDGVPPHLQPGFDASNPAHRQAAEKWVVVALAGEASQSLLEGRECDILRPSARGDYEPVLECAKLLHSDPDAQAAFIEGQKRVACDLVRQPLREHQIGAVANHLRVMRQLALADVMRIMEEMETACKDSL